LRLRRGHLTTCRVRVLAKSKSATTRVNHLSLTVGADERRQMPHRAKVGLDGAALALEAACSTFGSARVFASTGVYRVELGVPPLVVGGAELRQGAQ
jgi:hypothetical protein